jgi:hypothetical protein
MVKRKKAFLEFRYLGGSLKDDYTFLQDIRKFSNTEETND